MGSITPGKPADLVVPSKDIVPVPEAEIPTARVVLTILGGTLRAIVLAFALGELLFLALAAYPSVGP